MSLYTSKGARVHVCPMSMTGRDSDVKRCEGSNCMAWRDTRVGPTAEGSYLGYCGMAGIPLELLPGAATDTAKAFRESTDFREFTE